MSAESAPHITRVLITIDTEFRLGGSLQRPGSLPIPAERIIYCRIGGREYGINWIMDTLEHAGLRGVFFVETESRFAFGEDLVATIFDGIRDRGHEIQLHCHPAYRSFRTGRTESDEMFDYSESEQSDIIGEALRFLESRGHGGILAFRAGGFSGNQATIRAARALGLRFWSNYNLAVPSCEYMAGLPAKNDLFELEGGYEVPITCFREIPIRKEWNSMQTSSASGTELLKVMRHLHAQGTNVVCVLTHSFEFVHPHDLRYERSSPLPFMMGRLQALCDFLARNRDDYQVVGFRELDGRLQSGAMVPRKEEGPVFRSSPQDTFHRYLQNYVLPRLARP